MPSEFDEPWRVEATRDFMEIVSQGGKTTGLTADLPGGREAADRVVACVNFLAGVPTDQIEAFNAGCRDESKVLTLTSMLRERASQLGYVSSDPFDE